MSVYEFGPFRLDAGQLLLFDRGEPVALGPKVVETLLALIEHPGDVLTKSALLDRIWPEGFVDEANLAQNVYVLRKSAARPLGRRSDRNDSAARLSVHRAGDATSKLCTFRRSRPCAAGRAPTPALGIVRRGGARARPARRNGLRACRTLIARVAGAVMLSQAPGFTRSAATTGTCARPTGSSRAWTTSLASSIPIRTTPAVTPHWRPPTRSWAIISTARRRRRSISRERAPTRKKRWRSIRTAARRTPCSACSQPRRTFHRKQSLTDGFVSCVTPSHSIRRAPAHEWYGIALSTPDTLTRRLRSCKKPPNLDPLSVATTHGSDTRPISNATTTTPSATSVKCSTSRRSCTKPTRRSDWHTRRAATTGSAIDAFRAFGDGVQHVPPRSGGAARERRTRIPTARRKRAPSSRSREPTPSDVEPEDLALALAAVGERTVALSYFNASRRLSARGDRQRSALRRAARRPATHAIAKARLANDGRPLGSAGCRPRLARSLARHAAELKEGTLPPRTKELCALMVAWLNACENCSQAHAEIALSLGVDRATLDELTNFAHSDRFSPARTRRAGRRRRPDARAARASARRSRGTRSPLRRRRNRRARRRDRTH